MMPGENQSKVVGIASEATSGTCQNCTVLNQVKVVIPPFLRISIFIELYVDYKLILYFCGFCVFQSLDEYVAALLTLKQKIVDTEESSKLHKQLDEVLLKLEPLEKQTVEYEQMKTELEKTKADLKSYQMRCEDVNRLRAENAQTLTLKEKVEESLRQAEDTVQRQNLENEKLKTEKKSLEEDLQKTQDSLRKYVHTAEEHESLKLENAKTLILKGNLENEILVLKETNFQQDNEIIVLKNEKRRLEDMLYTTQEMTVGTGDNLLHGDYCMDLQDIEEWFKPLPTALSPVHSPSTELVQPSVPQASNVQSVSTLDVCYSESDSVENKELKSSVPLEMKTVADRSTYVIQSRLADKAYQSEEDDTSKPTEYQKSLDVRKSGGTCPLRPSKDEESSSEDEGFFGLMRKVRGVHSRSEGRIPSEELDNVSRNKQCSIAKQISKDEHQETFLEKTALSPSGLSTVIMESKDEKDSEHPENDKTAQNVCKLLSHKINSKDSKEYESESPGKTLVQMNNESYQQVDGMSADTHCPGVENFVSDVYNHKETSGDSAVDSLEDTSTPCLDTLDPEYSSFEKGSNISVVPGLNSKTQITPASCLSLGRVRTEMGPPLPPVVMPLTATPPRFGKHHTPLKPASISPRLPTDGPKMPSVPVFDSALPDASKMSPCLTTPSPSCGVPSSPLQFGSATPKHAVPVPGRLPSSALSSSPPASCQENSMQMLDTMYPELSARARTLNILRGNVNLTRAGNENGTSPPSVNQISGNKTISSSSTAFTKTEQKPKRTGVNMLLPKSAKRLRLDNCSPAPPSVASPAEQVKDHQTVIKRESIKSNQEIQSNQEERRIVKDNKTNDSNFQISEVLAKVGMSCFDVLPVVKSHVFLGRISRVPILTDEEKSVITDFCVNQSSAEKLMTAILTKLKTEKSILSYENVQALCRVYTGICRQMGDYQKAHAFACNILKEGRLGQLGMKQMLCKSVQNVAKAINLFGKHGITEGVPNEVQLSAVYAIYDLAPCNPKDALEALASWRSETTQPVPTAVTSCITQIGSLCRQMKS
ncbi:little elongation complex subunit 1-like isoform X2 [Labeo rohita]|uniref:Little elongation complex subunit 1-like isoform X2 n=1 Tax=Labeo rohita TaxID=84645 RepID=A0A498LCK0_LABRO|nr:little elongation complex subunit 1-like isoform X2 [Labeo rohita]RXN22868.1 little elongation complex subunit 1-like isoform X2 [Labeo rohita]